MNKYYPESQFGGFTDIDGTIAFYLRVNALVGDGSTVLDVGCGNMEYLNNLLPTLRSLRNLKGKCKKYIGIDIDEKSRNNQYLDEFFLIKDNHWPIGDNSVDVCICDTVLEHIEAPDIFFMECQRVIKPDGYLCIRTANVISYFGFFS